MPEWGKARCFLEGSTQPLPPSFQMPIGPEIINFTCSRVFYKNAATGKWFAPTTQVVFQLSEGSLILNWPGIQLDYYRVADVRLAKNQAANRLVIIRDLKGQIVELNEDIGVLEDEVDRLKTMPVLDWVTSNGTACDVTCQAAGKTAVSSGTRTGGVHAYGQFYYLCAASINSEGLRGGYNVQPDWANDCWVPYGGKELPFRNFSCLCENPR